VARLAGEKRRWGDFRVDNFEPRVYNNARKPGGAVILSEFQQILTKTARDFLQKRVPLDGLAESETHPDRHDAALWAEIAELGWLGVVAPESAGGSGACLADLELLCEELGRALCPAPVIAVGVAAGALLERSGSGPAGELLAKLIAGDARPVLAVSDERGRWSSASDAVRWGGEFLDGRKAFVEAAALGDRLVVTALDRDGHVCLVSVDTDAEGLRIRPQASIAGAHWAEVSFQDVPGEVLAGDWETVDFALTRTAAMQAGWCAGAARRLLEDTVAYVSERHQFGVPIGSFQAVQHSLADCLIAATESESLARRAAAALDANASHARLLASMAFVRAGEGFVEVARRCHQAWGGLGYTPEMHVHHFSPRAKAAQLSWGGTNHHLEIVAEDLHEIPLLRDRYATALAERGQELP
jgi:alkylation response protein AidB-like acyl-CoA dehydrogenase